MTTGMMYDVIVIGAGMAGLKAAFDARAAGLSTVIVEARDRVGGRIHTVREAGIAVERGAELIHSRAAETWALAREMRLETHRMSDAHIRTPQGALRDEAHFEGEFDEALLDVQPSADESVEAYLARVGLRRGAYPMTMRLLEMDYERLDRVGALEVFEQLRAQRAAGEAYGENDYRVIGGYDQLLTPLVRDAIVHYNQPVTAVECSPHGVRVTTQTDAVYAARAVIVTLPIGVLKAGHVRFTPDLPAETNDAIARLGVTDALKLHLTFAQPVLPRAVDVIVDERGTPPIWWNASAETPGFTGETVVGWATGNYARRLIALGEEQGIALGVRSLRAALDRPDLTPIHARMTHWNDDLYTLGAYSYAPPHGENAFAALAQPIAGTVFFAGEATDALWHSTVHGAYRSGARAAKAVTTALGKRG